MTKSNFGKLAHAPKLPRRTANDDERQAAGYGTEQGASTFAPAPRAEDASRVLGFGAVRALDGRSARRTGRTVQFATVVTLEFREWMKATAKARRKTQAAVLDDMRAAYVEKYGE